MLQRWRPHQCEATCVQVLCARGQQERAQVIYARAMGQQKRAQVVYVRGQQERAQVIYTSTIGRQKRAQDVYVRGQQESTGHLCQGHRSAEKSSNHLSEVSRKELRSSISVRVNTLSILCGMCKQENSRGHCCLHAVNASTKSNSSCSSKI